MHKLEIGRSVVGRNPQTMVMTVTKEGHEELKRCPLLLSQYVRRAEREAVMVPGLNPAWCEWVAKQARRLANG